MRFKWLKYGSEQAVVTMAFARCTCTNLTIAEAVQTTLETGRHCKHHELMSEKTFARLCKSVKQLVEVSKHAGAK